jgi:hypothetical protein
MAKDSITKRIREDKKRGSQLTILQGPKGLRLSDAPTVDPAIELANEQAQVEAELKKLGLLSLDEDQQELQTLHSGQMGLQEQPLSFQVPADYQEQWFAMTGNVRQARDVEKIHDSVSLPGNRRKLGSKR